MATPETAWRSETATLWAASSQHDAEGRRRVSAGVEIAVRWEDGRGQSVDERGTPIAYDATVVVGQAVPVGSILFRGTLAQWAAASSTSPSGLYEAVQFREARDVKGRAVRREVRLARYRDSLPEVAT